MSIEAAIDAAHVGNGWSFPLAMRYPAPVL
jgi:hypothetical protein